MLVVEINRANFEYDVHSIVKAFYAEEQVTVLTPQTGEDKRAKLTENVAIAIELKDDGAAVKIAQDEYEWEWNREEVYKDGFKRFLYRTLCQVTGKTLPWGNLTGIRPTKIAYGMLEEGKTQQEILDFYEKEHYVSREKAKLSIDIAERERKLLANVHYRNGYSLYIGIPFCPTTCLYCSFTSYPIAGYRKMVDSYVDAVIREMEYVSEAFKDKILDSVYIGGGTPTTLEAEQLDRLIGSLKSLFDFSTVQEFTVEAGRADSITEEKLKVLHCHGVSRISVNPQTMKQETLDAIGRKASVEQVLAENPSIQVVIDLHRDEMAEETRLVTDLDGRPTARFMFFNGLSRTKKTGNIAYLYNENQADNLAFSFQMQLKATEYYPGLVRKIYLKGYRYNMHLRPRTLLVELGAQNNTLEEAMNACDPLAHILDMVLSGNG